MKKRIICWLFILIMVFSLAGCKSNESPATSGENKETEDVFRVGFGKVDVTPYTSVNLGGYGDNAARMSMGYVNQLYALSVVMTDAEDNTLILIVTDLSWGYYVQAADVRAAIAEKYGISGEYVMLGGTHTHSAPAYTYAGDEVKEYLAYWLEGVMTSVEMAMEDRKPAKMHLGRTETEDLNFVRRYWLENGELMTDTESSNLPIVGRESEADEEVQLVKFTREGEKDILMVNWQAHASTLGNTLNISSEWVGVMRDVVDEELGCNTIYFQGACGNINAVSRIEGERRKTSPQECGQNVADFVIKAYRDETTFSEVETGLIKVKQEIYMAKQKEGCENKKNDLELNTISIGDLSVVTFPLEMFSVTGEQIKEQTPYKMTLLMGYTCGVQDYCPDEKAYENGGYEVTKCYFVKGTAEEMVSIYLKNLQELHQ